MLLLSGISQRKSNQKNRHYGYIYKSFLYFCIVNHMPMSRNRHILTYLMLVVMIIASTAIKLHHHRDDGSICMSITIRDALTGHCSGLCHSHEAKGGCHHTATDSECIYHFDAYEITKSLNVDSAHLLSVPSGNDALASLVISVQLPELTCYGARHCSQLSISTGLPRAVTPRRGPPCC